MDILILGGTGAMGTPLVNILSKEHKLWVTTRSQRENLANIVYLQGNAMDPSFFSSLMDRHYDAIIDFMIYKTEQFKARISSLLEHTDQYFFFSSSRCYADANGPITEDSPRLIDVCTDPEYLSTDEYGLFKGREENLLFESGRKNWTIIRPYITFNTYRIQLGVYEKENWLRRALEGKSILFPKDIASKKTSLTYGPDVAASIASLIGNERAYGEAFHIVTPESHTWGEILDFYCDKIEEITGKRPKVKLMEDSKDLMKIWNKWQIKYDRLYHRIFDPTKLDSIRGNYEYKPTFEYLGSCLEDFIASPAWLNTRLDFEAWCDSHCGEWTPLKDIPGKKNKLRYLNQRIFGFPSSRN